MDFDHLAKHYYLGLKLQQITYIDREKNHGNSKEKNHFISSICTQQIYRIYQKTNHSDDSQ